MAGYLIGTGPQSTHQEVLMEETSVIAAARQETLARRSKFTRRPSETGKRASW